MKFIQQSLSKWLQAVIILLVGILCIIAGAASGDTSANAYDAISTTLGIVSIVMGSISILLALIANIITKGKTPFLSTCLGGVILLTAGIYLLISNFAGKVIYYIVDFVPYLLIVVGSALALEVILNLIFAIIAKNFKGALIAAIVDIIVAAVAIVLGALSCGDDPVINQKAKIIIFGIILIICAILIVLNTFIALPKSIIVVKAEADVQDAEVSDVNDEKQDTIAESNNEEKAE